MSDNAKTPDLMPDAFGDIAEFNVRRDAGGVNRVMVPVLGFDSHEQRTAAIKAALTAQPAAKEEEAIKRKFKSKLRRVVQERGMR